MTFGVTQFSPQQAMTEVPATLGSLSSSWVTSDQSLLPLLPTPGVRLDHPGSLRLQGSVGTSISVVLGCSTARVRALAPGPPIPGALWLLDI